MAHVDEAQAGARLDRLGQNRLPELPELKLFSHSSLFYWWPLWLIGYAMAAITYLGGIEVSIPPGAPAEIFYPSKNLGVIYTVAFVLVILITNVSFRGLASVVLILSVMFFTVLFAYLGWWDDIISWLPHLAVHMNLGFYLFFSTLIFIIWAFATFMYDNLSYWRIRPGQVTHEFVIGGAEKSYDTDGMVFEKHHQDFFRHWLLGVGAGDIRIMTTGARREELQIPNVLFVDWKVNAMQKLIAMKPDQMSVSTNP